MIKMTFEKWISCLGVIAILILVFYIAADHVTPATSDAYINADVIPVRVFSDSVINKIHVQDTQKITKGEALFSTVNGNIYKSPINGYVTNFNYAHGSYMQSDDRVMTLVNGDTWHIVANISENNLSNIRPGQRVGVSIDMYPGRIFEGKVAGIGWGVEIDESEGDILPGVSKATNWVSLAQKFPVKIELTNYDFNKYPLRVGATASVTIYTEDNGFIPWLSHWLHVIAAKFNYLY